MIRAGLTGGLASGKSFVGRTLESFGCHLVRAAGRDHDRGVATVSVPPFRKVWPERFHVADPTRVADDSLQRIKQPVFQTTPPG